MEVLYRYFRWLSLDVVMGAIFVLAYLGKYYQVHLPFSVYVALGAAIWLIYTTDHLIDARKVASPSSPRHRFHKEHFSWLIIISGLVLICGLVNMVFLPEVVIRNGALLSAGCVGYLVLVFVAKKLWVKELIVAVAYAVGIFLGPASLAQRIVFIDVLYCSQLAMIALINLMIFSFYDQKRDRQDGFGSLVITVGTKYASWLIHGMCLLSISCSLSLVTLFNSPLQFLYLLMSVVLYGVFLVPAASYKDRFRVIGDGVFYLPILFVL